MHRFYIAFLMTIAASCGYAHTAFLPSGAVASGLVSVSHRAYLMTSPDAVNRSDLHIVNSSDTSQQFYGTLYDESGARIGDAETLLTTSSIPAYGRTILTSQQLRDLFGGTWKGPAMLEVFGADSFSLLIRLTSPSGLVSNTNCVTSKVVHNLDGSTATDVPYIRFINTGNTAISNIRGTLYDASGSVVGTANTQLIASLAAKQQVFINRDALANLIGSQWTDVSSLYVSAGNTTDNNNLKLLLINYIVDNNTFFNFSCIDGADDLDNPVPDAASTTQGPDITDLIFTQRSADCATYDATYFANVTDVKRNLAFTADITVSSDGSSCTLKSDGIPNHSFNDATANFATNVAEVNRTFNISRSPQIAGATSALSQSQYDAVMLNGVVLDLLSAGCYKPNDPQADSDGNTAIGCQSTSAWLLDPLGVDHKFGADIHNAHTQPDGTYHYHGNPNAMFDTNPGSSGSPVIGFAADGFPVYGSYFLDPATNTVRKAISGYQLKSGSRGTKSATNPGGTYDGTYIDDYSFTNSGDLDACNGMTVAGQYGYYVTDTYPWVMGCLSGISDTSFHKN